MFNFSAINVSEVNASSAAPTAPVLSINASEDINTLSWTSPYHTDFFVLYWSDQPFSSIDEVGVHAIVDPHGIADDPNTNLSYDHNIPSSFSLSVLYYRVSAFNSNGNTLSEQVDSYNFKLAIYNDLYNATLDALILRFTPELKRQYEDSILWRSFVQSLCSEMSRGRFQIKEALKQLNLQKAIEIFLNLWSEISGISRQNNTNYLTGDLETETDAQYRQRLFDNIFWDKISNLALKKTMLLKLGYDGDVLDAGVDPGAFKVVSSINRVAPYGNAFVPGEMIDFLFVGSTGTGLCVSDNGSSLSFSGYSGPAGQPYSLYGQTSHMSATPTGPPVAGSIQLISNGAFNYDLNGWTDCDSGFEGPADPTVYIYRPTAWASARPEWLGNPTNAYDSNLSSYASVYSSSFFSRHDFYVYGFSNLTFPVTTLNLKLKYTQPATHDPLVAYSLDGGSSWISYDGAAFSGTRTIALSPSQVLSLVQVRFSISSNTTYVYDVSIEASGTNEPGTSLWSSFSGGSMQLNYGVAAREYVMSTSPGQTCTLSFDVISSTYVEMIVGSSSGASDLVASAIYPTGSYSLPAFAATGTSTYVRFYASGENIAYVDNVSCMGTSGADTGTLPHDAVANPCGLLSFLEGDSLTFIGSGATATFVSNNTDELVFRLNSGSNLPMQWDIVRKTSSPTGCPQTILMSQSALFSTDTFNSKLLSNIYSVNLGVATLDDASLNDIYEEISSFGAVGNVLIKILQDVATSFEDWDTTLGNIPYGPIFMGAPTYSAITKSTEINWSVSEEVYIDNQWKMNDEKTFYGNDGPDDIIILTRTS